MELIKEKLECTNCWKKFEYESRDRVEVCDIVGSPHYQNVISWDDRHRPHDIYCPRCGEAEGVGIIDG